MTSNLPNVTASGFVPLPDESSMFFAYYEAAGVAEPDRSTPIILWLQGGPGCASMFGNLYELGPSLVDEDLQLIPNPGSWNRRAGLLFLDQPVGTGFSVAGKRGIPEDEMGLAADLYQALQAFFLQFEELQRRPLIIAGESYAGKYVPSIGHFILQQSEAAGGLLEHRRPLPSRLHQGRPHLAMAPVFDLQGLAIGNGLTDPRSQVVTHADTAYFLGLLDPRQRVWAMARQLEILQFIALGLWSAAHEARSSLLEYIRARAGVATLLDVRRGEDYDAAGLTDCYLNLPEVQEALGVGRGAVFESCSEEVGRVLGPDVMQSVVHLVPDLLKRLPVLLYQGQWDGQDGPATNEAWIYGLEWHGRDRFYAAKRRIMREGAVAFLEEEGDGSGAEAAGGAVAGWWKSHSTLVHVVVAGAGHMVPRDQPEVAADIVERWLRKRVLGQQGAES